MTLIALFNLSTHTLQNLLDAWSYVAVFAFVAIESSGIPFPGETMLVTAAVYSGTGHLSIALVILAAASGAIIGDNVGYIVGRTGGRTLALRYGKRIGISQEKLDVAEDFFERHGDKTVFLGRFVAVLRAWAAFLAGVNRMHWAKFFLYNAAGGIVWSTVFGILGYALGKNLSLLHRVQLGITIGGIAVAVAVAGVLYIAHRRGWRRRGHRSEATKDQQARAEDKEKATPAV